MQTSVISKQIMQSTANTRQVKSNERYSPSPSMTTVSVPRYGTTVPNRIFVGGITTDTAESELQSLFLQFGNVKAVKIINDRAGIPKGYGFVTFETDEEAKRVLSEADNLTLKGRKLNVAIAVKKQVIGRPLGTLCSDCVQMCNRHHYKTIDATQFMPNGTILFPNTIPMPAYDSSSHFAYGGPDTLYPLTCTPSAGAMASTYPIIYHQHPIFIAQPQAAPALNAYANTHFPTASTNTSGNYPGTHFQTANSAATQWATAAFSMNPSLWQWSSPGGDCVPYVNMNNVALNK